jgi:metal-responsive CopG/Arc/MetJ family transcriptional regulator
MKRIESRPKCYASIGVACDKALVQRVDRIARRDGVSRSTAARTLIEAALPQFESTG